MNKDLIDIFNVQYNAKGEKLITDNYTLADGTYIMVNTDGNIKYQKEFDKKVSQIIEFEEFITRDYLSKYLDSDKAVANKNIHSNNYMSFFIKKETLDLEKFLKKQKEKNKKIQDINDIKIFILDFIDDYFNTLENPKKNKSKIRNNKKTLNLYKEIEKEIGEPNIEKVNYCRNWIKENIFQIGENLKDYKG